MEINQDILLENETPVEPGMWRCSFGYVHPVPQQCDCDHE